MEGGRGVVGLAFSPVLSLDPAGRDHLCCIQPYVAATALSKGSSFLETKPQYCCKWMACYHHKERDKLIRDTRRCIKEDTAEEG